MDSKTETVSDNNMGHIFDKAKLTEKQAGIALTLTSRDHLKEYRYRVVDIFEYGDRYFFGNYESLVLAFVKNNPTGGDFYVWLQQQELEVKLH